MAQSNRKFWIGLLVGSVVGTVSALLLAPKAGRELRHDLAEGAKQANEKSQQLAKQVSDKTSEWVEAAKEKTSDWKHALQERFSSHEEKALVSSIVNEQADGIDIEVQAEIAMSEQTSDTCLASDKKEAIAVVSDNTSVKQKAQLIK
ncbi:YtxH domain-containing protein [Paenibacillus sp. ACRRX]|uniref:YtxH domain-containing protein n=1 Tax=unclassified Paenibacillus TaxID=185978 RepID=UPI001EF49E70|nr:MULTISPECIES: YtxH domain-containing protein [unclassified Paenibacillus]MCG7405979.1 YtxH domain-containing protein [Paenibacillus sp. ACRRX]MDK8182432.1 YtxH domain-containing protein [Paenibacillus sp. UMB4589-SE434]